MVSVLFTEKDSIYEKLNVDYWNEKRDATKWPGGNAIIAHPPCRSWSRLKGQAKPKPGEKWLTVWSVLQIRKHGGILEHPRSSSIWKYMKLPNPGQTDQYGGFTITLRQHWFGHPCEKETRLYICGITENDLPSIPISFDAITQTLGKSTGSRNEIPKKYRSSTPIKFAIWLIQVADLINNNKNKQNDTTNKSSMENSQSRGSNNQRH